MWEQSTSTTCIICGVILTTVLLQPVGACMRAAPDKQATVAPKTKTIDENTNSNDTSTIPPSIFQYNDCTATEENKLNCLNKGTCVQKTNIKDKSQTTYCECLPNYTGRRCETAPRPSEKQREMNIGIGAAVIVGVIIAAVVIGLLIYYKKCVKSRRESSIAYQLKERERHNKSNGATDNSEAHENTRTPDSDDREELQLLNNNSAHNGKQNPA